MTSGIHIYFNMGVKRSGRTSGVQPTILDIKKNCVQGQKLKYPVSWFFLCIFENFFCIICQFRGSTSRPPRNLKFLVFLSIPHRNGISLSANSYLTFVFSGPPYGGWSSPIIQPLCPMPIPYGALRQAECGKIYLQTRHKLLFRVSRSGENVWVGRHTSESLPSIESCPVLFAKQIKC